jgi:uncharacterized protein
VFLVYGQYVLTNFLVIIAIGRFIPAINLNQQQQILYDHVTGPELLLVFLSLVVITPIVEEILFRGFLFRGLRKNLSLKASSLITSLLFGAAHLELLLSSSPPNWVAGIDTFILSMFMCHITAKTDSLWPAIMLHSLKNLVAFIILFVI